MDTNRRNSGITSISEHSLNESTGEKKVETFFSNLGISVEPILFLHNVASQMVWITSQDLMKQKSCRVNLGYSKEICENLSDYESQETEVQILVSDFLMWRSILETAIKIISVPLLGWWGDQKGRKYPIIFSLTGIGLESLCNLIISMNSSWPLETMLAGSFFYGISGSTHGLLMLAFSFMANRTNNRTRTMKIGILDGFYYLGSPVGMAISSPIFKSIGYTGVFAMSVAIYVLTIIYVLISIPRYCNNNILAEENSGADCGILKITSAFRSTFRKRPLKVRRYILILIIAMLFDSYVIWGELTVKYLFAQKVLDWTYSQYSHYGTASSLLTVVGALLIVPLLTKVSLDDTIIGLLGALSRTLERIVYAFATSPNRSWLMYVGATIGVGSPLAPIGIRSQLSKIAYEDIGQVYATMAVFESLLQFGAAPVYTRVYESTIDMYAGCFFLLSAALNSLMGCCFVYVYFSRKHQNSSLSLDVK